MFLIEDKFSRLFQSGSFILNDFCKQKMDFLTLDKTFVLDNLNFVQDKIFFVRADGRGNSWQKTLFCHNACLKLASHQNCILKVNFGQKMIQFYHIPRKSYQLDIFKGFLLVTVGPFCISYCHMKTAPPMNTFATVEIKNVHRWRCFHLTI